MKPSIAVIGSGIAGLATNYYLREKYDVTLIEKNNYIGGHTNTITLKSENGKDLPIDSGFMVFNDTTYPNLVRLFDELEVNSYDTSMSFGVQNTNRGLEFACSGFSSFFADKTNILSIRHWRLYKGILAFFKAAEKLMAGPPDYEISIRDFAQKFNLSQAVVRDFILPMTGAIWSTPPERILSSPALPLIRFMHNHRMLGIGIQLQWKTVENGSDQYKKKLLARLPNTPQTGRNISRIGEDYSGAYFFDENGHKHSYDFIVVATHADQALALLQQPTDLQQNLLSKFKYNKNSAVLHSDESVMPESKKAWASWNVSHSTDSQGLTRAATHYWMNSLQKIDSDKNYFVSIDNMAPLDPDLVHWQTIYTHPLFDTEAIKAQPRLKELNESGKIKFCGSYFRNGFHEDALWSALNVVNTLNTVCERRPS